jgi:serine/threonine-protein kinase
VTPERYQRLGQLYHAALEVEPQSRASFLRSACGSDEELRREVELLLAAHNNVGNYFEAPALEVAAGLVVNQEHLSLTGQSFSHYQALSLICVGGMGEVYLAEDTRLGRKVALKMLPSEFTQDQERVRRFAQEARAASALNHPNIVTIYEVGQVDGRHFIATEYIEGETLRERLSSGAIEFQDAVEVGAQMARALQAAHEAGIVHRDIKPENVMVRRDGLVKVLDFGLAKLTGRPGPSAGSGAATEEEVTSAPGQVIGTVGYMSPEQARGENLDQRTDVFSLGMVLYEMVAGQSPFAASGTAATLSAILDQELKPLAQHAPNVPVEMELIVRKALRKNKDERYQTAGDLATDLKDLKQKIEVDALLQRSGQPERSSVRTMGGQAGVATLENAAVRTDEPATATTMSSAEYLLNEVRRHKLWVSIATAVLIPVVALAYLFYPRTRGEAIESMAVLPFVNATGDPNTEYLPDVISDSIINSLNRLPNLRVISYNAVLRYKGQQVQPQAVGRELNVQAVLMGRMTKRGDGLTISMELVDVRDNRRLWGEQYNRKLADVIAVDKEVVRGISEKLHLTLGSTDEEQLTKRYTESTEAYYAYLKGRSIYQKLVVANFQATQNSIKYFEEAIKLDPNYALAYTALANIHEAVGTSDGLREAKACVAKALEIDDRLAEAYAVKGNINLAEEDWSGAERAFKRASELNPNYERYHAGYPAYLWTVKRLDEAVAESKRALELDPLSITQSLTVGKSLYFARRYDEAIEQCQKTLELAPDVPAGATAPQVYRTLGQSYEQKKLYDQAVEAWLKTVEFTIHGQEAEKAFREAYAETGWKGFWRKLLDFKIERAKKTNVHLLGFAEAYTRIGEKDQAFDWLEKAYQQRRSEGRLLRFLSSDPTWDVLRSDTRYTDLVRRMGLEP